VGSQQFLVDAPVHEEELPPSLVHDGLTIRTMTSSESINISNVTHRDLRRSGESV